MTGRNKIAPYATLRGADLRGANLRGVDLRGADLSAAGMNEADLTKANLCGASLTGADLAAAELESANLSEASLTGATLPDDVPVVENIDARILDAVRNGNVLDMTTWHTCETTHCRAGWAIHLAGPAGYELEKKVGPCAAGALIYAASRAGKPVPDFFASTKVAMDDIRKDAEAQS